MKQKLTQWHDWIDKPSMRGVYQAYCGIFNSDGYAFWNGKYWACECRTIEGAGKVKEKSAYQNKRWRGLAEKPD